MKTDHQTARLSGIALLGTILVGMLSAFTVAQGIDINLSANLIETTGNMLESETQLRGKAYFTLLVLALQAFVCIGFYTLLKRQNSVLAGWSLFLSLAAAILSVMSSVLALNVAEIATQSIYESGDMRKPLAALQATTDYTSFHLGLIIGCIANAGFYYLFLQSGRLPKWISAFGLFASLFVASMIIARDFIPILGHDLITAAFMLSNLIALISTGLYLTVKGVKER